MKKIRTIVRWRTMFAPMVLLLLLVSQVWAQETSAVRATLVVKVSDRDQAADEIVAVTEDLKGYFTEKSQQVVILKVPVNAVEAVMTAVGRLGELVDRQFFRQDLANELLTKRAALKAKLDVQQQYEHLLSQADVEAILYVEKELIQLVAKIETLKGAIRHLEHRIRFAQIQVSFEYRDRPAPVADGRSSFKWLNTMNLNDLLRNF